MKCPCLEEVIVQYCTACPVKKMIPKEGHSSASHCEGNYEECPIYREFMTRQDTQSRSKKNKTDGEVET
jgi:hypothetical protein